MFVSRSEKWMTCVSILKGMSRSPGHRVAMKKPSWPMNAVAWPVLLGDRKYNFTPNPKGAIQRRIIKVVLSLEAPRNSYDTETHVTCSCQNKQVLFNWRHYVNLGLRGGGGGKQKCRHYCPLLPTIAGQSALGHKEVNALHWWEILSAKLKSVLQNLVSQPQPTIITVPP